MKTSIKTSKLFTKVGNVYRTVSTRLREQIKFFIDRIKNLALIFDHLRKKQKIDTLKFYPLYPNIEPSDHRIYTDALNEALSDKDIHNIALTGGYGSGKSSVLKDFTQDKQDRTVFISFSTLGADITRYTIQDPAKEKDKENGLDSVANLIQKEIVKHILYREKYARVPASRYPKIHQARFSQVLMWSLAITSVFPPAIYAIGFLNLQKISNLRAAIFMSLLFVLMCYIVQAIMPLLKKIQPDKISGGPVSIALSTSTNYFDQYLDEIIYFFEVTGYDIVILEDIDRFNNLYIFENLRQLNTLLNNSRQINKTIRFIYAVKDSIFHADEDEDGQKDVSNRTKFFDLIVPTVPFITHKNSRDVLLGMFEKYGVTRGVLGVVSKHVTDMRLVKNIHNEFIVFYEKIFKEGKIRELSVSNLLALIVYKNIEVQDFEKIKLGTSRLETIYSESRAFIKNRLDELNDENVRIRQRLRAIDSIDRRSVEFGTKLVSHIQDMLDDNNGVLVSHEFNGKSYARNNELKTKDLWTDICNADADGIFKITYQKKVAHGQYNYGGNSVATLSIDELKQIVGDELDASRWNVSDAKPLQNRLNLNDKEVGSIRSKSIKQLMADYPEFKTSVIAMAGCELLSDLLASGYIDANYALYTSIYREESVSAQGMNYIIHNLQANKQDVYYTFNGDEDIQNTLLDLDEIYFNNRNIYNLDILNFLLRSKDSRLEPILENLADGTESDRSFLDKFLEGDNESTALVAQLVQLWPDIFDYLVGCVAISDETRSQLLHIAIINSNHDIDYTATDAIRKFFANYAHTVACIAQNHSDEATNKARLLLKQFGVKIASLSEINNTSVLSLIEENDLYEINAANISKLIKGQNLALDIVKNQSAHAFNYVCKHLHDYLGAVEASEATPYTIENGDSFAEVLNSIGGQGASVVDMVVAKVSNDCLIEDITSVNEATWDALFNHVRASNMVHNVLNYFIKNGQQLNSSLDDYLDTAQNIVGACEEEDHKASKSALAIAILNSQSMSLERKMTLVNELDLKEYLVVEEIQAEGEIFGRLLDDDIVEDSVPSFNQLVDKTWSSRESYIAHSSEFLSYVTELTIKTEDLSKIPGSLIVPNEIKNYFLNNALAYKDLLSAEGKEHLASYALEGKFALSADILTLLVDYLSPEKRLQLLITSRSKLSREDVVTLLSLLGGEYVKLAQPGKRPLFEDNELNKELLEWLRSLSVVNTINQEKGKLRANVKAIL